MYYITCVLIFAFHDQESCNDKKGTASAMTNTGRTKSNKITRSRSFVATSCSCKYILMTGGEAVLVQMLEQRRANAEKQGQVLFCISPGLPSLFLSELLSPERRRLAAFERSGVCMHVLYWLGVMDGPWVHFSLALQLTCSLAINWKNKHNGSILQRLALSVTLLLQAERPCCNGTTLFPVVIRKHRV
jgi:hypothetical protein